MTGAFTAVYTMVELAENDIEIIELLMDVFPKIAKTVVDEQYSVSIWCLYWYEGRNVEMDLEDWSEYFDYVHSLDHATDHRAFSRTGLNLFYQLRVLLGVRHNPYKDGHQFPIVLKKYEIKTLLKMSETASDFFHNRYKHDGHGMWVLKNRKRIQNTV